MSLCDRRAKTLSSYAGDTALPGGRVDDEDKTIEDTAVRSDGAHLLISLTGLSLRDEKHSRRSYFYRPLLPDVIRADDRTDWPSTGQDQIAPTMYPRFFYRRKRAARNSVRPLPRPPELSTPLFLHTPLPAA